MGYLFLGLAIITEVAATLALRMATSKSKKKRLWLLVVVAGYGVAFFGLTMALTEGVPLGVAYGIWAAAGVALTAVFSRIFFKEPLTKLMLLGIALIMVGVLLIELGASH